MIRIRDIVALLRRPTPPPPVVSEFSGEQAYQASAVSLRMRKPIVAGTMVVLLLVFGLFLWAAIASISGAVLAAGVVKVEGNSKEIKHLEAGIIRRIYVHEGQRVAAGQLLMRFDNTTTQASVDILQAASDNARVQVARFQAEATNTGAIDIPADILARSGNPNVATLIESQRNLLATRLLLYRSQADEFRGQVSQLSNQIAGLQAQVASSDGQSALINDELRDVRALNKDGYAPRTRLLALERTAVSFRGQRGSLNADIARTRQAISGIRIQLSELDQKRETEAADGIRTAQAQLTELSPRLRAATESLAQIDIRAPVAGYVFNLTQFTEGGVAGAGERLMAIVPDGSKLVIACQVRPHDIADVKLGMPARVTLSAYNPRTTPQVDGRVTLVSADATDDPQLRQTYYTVHVTVDPDSLAKAGSKVRLTPGMPTTVAIVTGQRTVLDYLIGPMTESMRSSLRER